MKRNHTARKTLSVIAAVALVGCASQGSWKPVVDTHTDANLHNLGRDEAQCKYLAQEASGGTAQKTAVGTLVGGLIGAAAGAAIGAAVGVPGRGAAIGAAAGGIGGGTQQGLSAEEEYKRAYINCLRGRGHNVINS